MNQDFFDALNGIFEKIWVLTLPRLGDRRSDIEQELKGLRFEFFNGIDKKDIDLAGLKELDVYNSGRYRKYNKRQLDMHSGMLACTLGHLKMYETIKEKGYQRTLILEDDIFVAEPIPDFPSMFAELPKDWDLFYLGYEKNENYGFREQLKRMVYLSIPYHNKLRLERVNYYNYYARPYAKHLGTAGFHDCTHAYALSYSSACTLLEFQKPVAFNADNLLAYACSQHRVKGFIAKPKLFKQKSAFSGKLQSLTSD